MEPIDAAHQRFRALVAEVSDYVNSVETEADTRLKIIDRILVEALHWPRGDISAESASEGGFADYACHVQGRFRLILEAKRDGRSLGCEDRSSGHPYKLNGPVFKEEAAKEGIGQAIRYAGAKNAELACVTNGREWIVFRGNRLGDGVETREGMAFVFANLVEIEEHFRLFYSLLSYESVSTFAYRPYFQEAEGQPIRTAVFNRALRPAGSARFMSGGDLAADVDKIMTSFFQRLTGDQDPDLLEMCFVETAESHHADVRLAKIAEDIVDRIQSLDTGSGSALTQLITRAQELRRHEFVLIVGTKGAGKSTFISRFFRSVLTGRIAEKCVVVHVDLRNSTGDATNVVPWLDAHLLSAAEAAIFPEAPAFTEIEGMFFDEYTRLRKGPWAALYEADKPQFQTRFGDKVEAMRRDDPHEYIRGLIRHVVNGRQSLPVIVFDNADHFDIDYQQKVYQYARSIYEEALCLVLLPITDRTSWQLTKHGALQSFEHEALFLPTPPTDEIIRKRIAFIERRVEVEKLRPDDRYFLERGISLRLEDVNAFVRTLQRVFLQTSEVSQWIGDLANHDVRRTLNLARAFIASPHLKVADLLSAFISGSAIDVPLWRCARALIRQHYDIYPAGQQDFVQNVFALNGDLATTPLLGARLLQLLADVPVREHEGAVIDVQEIVVYFTGMNIENRAVVLWLDTMLKTGLLLNYDPTVQDIAHASRVEISPAGRHHLYWATGNTEYLSAMAETTPLLTPATYHELRQHTRDYEWRNRSQVFLDYVLREDELYCVLPEHDAYESQRRLRKSMESILKRLSALPAPTPTKRRPSDPRRSG